VKLEAVDDTAEVTSVLLSQTQRCRFGRGWPMALSAAHSALFGLAILAGGRGAHAQDANATPQISIDYAEPAFPGYDFRLRFESIPGSSVGLIISAPTSESSDSLALTNAELASAVIIPLVETSPGEMTIQGFSPVEVSLETLRAAGLRLRLVIANNQTGSVEISEPIVLVSTPASATGSSADVAASTATSDAATQSSPSSTPEVANPNATNGLSSTSSVAASVSASSSASTSTSSDSDGEVAAIMSSSGAGSSGTTSTGGFGSGTGTSSTTSAGSFGNGIGKPALSPWSLNSQLVRLISQNTSFSSHDQPAPIQGSGH